jgi:hypothetical protein
MNFFINKSATEIGTLYFFYFVEIFAAVFIENNYQLLFALVNYISIRPPVFNSKRLTQWLNLIS